MLPNLILNSKSYPGTNKTISWENQVKVDSRYITTKKNVRCNIQSIDRSKSSNKYQIQLGTGINDSYKILFGISSFGDRQTERSDMNINLDNEASVIFSDLDTFIVDSIIARKDEFFEGKSDEFVREAYYGCVKQDKELRYNPYLKCKVTLGENKNLNSKVYQWVQEGESSIEGTCTDQTRLVVVESNDKIRELILPNTECMCIIQVQSLWFKNDGWGVSMEARLVAAFSCQQELQFFVPSVIQTNNIQEKEVHVGEKLTEQELQQMHVLDESLSVTC
jgi:hypothetical protein